MPISFNSVPTNLRVPFVAVEFDNSKASQGPALLSYRALIIAQKTNGHGVANTIVRVTNETDAIYIGGNGSQIHRMCREWLKNNTETELWVGVLANGTTAATGTITVGGAATADGVIHLWVAGELYDVPVTNGQTAIQIATAIVNALGASGAAPVTAANSGTAVVTLTAKTKGTIGNYIDVRLDYADGQVSSETPTIVAMSSGAGNPALTSLIAAMGDNWYNIIAHPYGDDSTNLTALENELVSRAGPMRMIDGLAISSVAGTLVALENAGTARNNQYSTIVGQPGKNPIISPDEFAAQVAGVIAKYGAADPARPYQTIPLVGALPPIEADRFTITERNLLLYDGIATTKVGPGGVVQLERMITTWQLNSQANPDTSYLDVTTVLTLMYLRYSWRARILSRFPRHKLADDGTRFGAGQAVLTPKLMKAEAFAWFREMEEAGLVENFDQFKADVVVERNQSDPNRVDVLLPPDIINQFIVGAAQIQFRL